MNNAFLLIEQNLGISTEGTISLIVFFAIVAAFYARDFKIGAILGMVGFGAIFVWFYTAGWMWQLPLILSLIQLVILALILFFTQKTANIYGV